MRSILLAVLVAACGGSNGTTSDPGTGSQTLLVTGHVDAEGGNASASIHVQRAGADVTDAVVTIESDINASTTLPSTGGGKYESTIAGWGKLYRLSVTAGTDHLSGSIAAPEEAPVTSPDPTKAFDPHNAAGGIVTVDWSGARADAFHLKMKDFDWQSPSGMSEPDNLQIPATQFTDTSLDVEIERTNSVNLAGGVAGSQLSSQNGTRTTLIVTNPFPKP